MVAAINDNLVDVVWDEWKPNSKTTPSTMKHGGWIEDPASDDMFGADWNPAYSIARSEWRDRIEDLKKRKVGLLNFLEPLNNQSPESSCVYNATECCIRAVWNRTVQDPKFWIKLSPMSGYIRVTRRRHSGSYMAEAANQLERYGLLPENRYRTNSQVYKHVFHQNTPFVQRESLPDGWQTTARHFRALKWMRIRTRDQFGSALLHRLPICYGRRGHCICGVELVWDAGRRRYLCKYLDSYGPGRGENGCLFDSESNWGTGGTWCLVDSTTPHDSNLPAGADTKTPISEALAMSMAI